MISIYKYHIEVKRDQAISLPHSFKILSIQEQTGNLEMWAMVNTENLKYDYVFKVVETGSGLDFDDARFDHIATVQTNGGRFVWHIFIDKVSVPIITERN